MPTSSPDVMPLPGVRLALALLLFGAELLVCVAALHPHVSAEYRAHYMTWPPSCWIPPSRRAAVDAQPLPQSFDIKALAWPQTCRVLPAGWDVENWGAWTIDRMALLRLPVGPDTRAIRFTFTAPAYMRDGQTVRLVPRRGAASVRAVIAPVGQTAVTVPVDAAARVAGQIELRLIVAWPRSPASFGLSNDIRALGVGLVHVRLE